MVLHASDPASVYLAASARSDGASVADIDNALFVDRTLLRTLAMRRTLFVATTELAGTIESSSSIGVAASERKRLEKFLTESAMVDPKGWLTELFSGVSDALDDAPDGLPAKDLTAAVPALATRITMGAGTKHAAEVGATSRVLGLMAVEGLLVRGRPVGDWTSRMYRWHRRDRWWPNEGGPVGVEDEQQAAVDLVTRWLHRFGPGTLADLKWWTGWTMTRARAALAAIDTVEVELEAAPDEDGSPVGYLLADDADPVDDPAPWAALLPALDPTAMGWKQRHWYLGEHRAPLFDRNGNIGPTVWVDGRIVGGWSQDPDGRVVVAMLESVDDGQRALIDVERERVAAFVGSVIVKPSFPTPLQKALSAGQDPAELT